MNFTKLYRLLFSSTALLSVFGVCSTSFGQSGTGQSVQLPTTLTASSAPETRSKKVLIFDLGGVLFETSHTGMSGEMHCYWDFVQYALHFKNPAKIKNVAFSALDDIFVKQVPPEGCACAMADRIVMPGIMCKWMCGTAGRDIIALVNRELESGEHDKLFSSSIEKNLVKKLVGIMFDPTVLAKHTHPIKKGLEILEECAARDDLQLMILSNYGADAFEELYNKEEAQKVFCHFAPEKIVVSGFIGTMKPYHSIYEYLKKQYHLDPAECIIIDDQKENIEAAKKEGFETIWVKKGNFLAVRKQLVKLKVIAG